MRLQEMSLPMTAAQWRPEPCIKDYSSDAAIIGLCVAEVLWRLTPGSA